MATNLLDLMGYMQGQYKDGQTQGKQSALANLAGQAYGAPRDQRQGLVQQAIGVDPQSGFALDKSLQGGDDAKMVRVKQLAGSLVAMPEQMRPQAYSRVMQELQGIGMGEGLPPSWSEDLLPYAQQLASGEKSDLPNSVQEYQYAQKNPGYQQFLSGRDPTQLTQIDYTDPATGQVGKLQVQWNPRTKQMTDMDGNPVYPNGGQAQDSRPQGMGSTGGGAQVLDDALSNAVMQQESGGDPNAVSSAGARGLMQIMPETARDPGYGVQPMQNQSPQENVRIGQDYLKAMLAKYGGNQQLALAAYNGGPGRVDAALQRANGNPQQAMQYLPQETQKYPGAVQARMGQSAPTAGRTGFTAGKAEKPQFQSRQYGAQEVAQMGLPPGTVAYTSEDGTPKIVNKPDASTVATSPAQRAVDAAFGKDYVDFIQIGASDVARSLEELATVSARLGGTNDNISGPAISALPFAVRQRMFPNSADTQQTVERTIQSSLRAVLGAQYTQKEGEMLLARTYNPALEEADNKTRVDRLALQLQRALESKQAASTYFEQNGTLAGYRGKVDFSVNDFTPDDGGAPSQKPKQPAQNITTKAQYDALPSGAVYMEDGKQYRKP